MGSRYQKIVEKIQRPQGLDGRVLMKAARRQEVRPRGRRPLLRAAVCTACALALVAGAVSLYPAEDKGRSEDIERHEGPDVLSLSYDLGLTAHAAGANGGVVLLVGQEEGAFRISGEGIETITLSVDRGELCLGRGKPGAPLGASLTQKYDPEARYSLLVSEDGPETFDGAELRVTAVFADGTERTAIYHLSAEALRAFENENGSRVLVPALAGDDQASLSGLYAVSEQSRWLCWPVEGSSTVSLSNAYGCRQGPGGGAGTFHAGIDIPGKSGLPVLAAAGGAVTETGFDAQRGNYLVIDHGGGLATLYGQCREVLVEEGDAVAAGAPVARMGNTGMSTGPHLHFEVRQDGEAQNPVAYFNGEVRDTLRMV